jgi:hypothetical protein
MPFELNVAWWLSTAANSLSPANPWKGQSLERRHQALTCTQQGWLKYLGWASLKPGREATMRCLPRSAVMDNALDWPTWPLLLWQLIESEKTRGGTLSAWRLLLLSRL